MVKLTSRETLTRVFNGKDSYVLSLSNDTHTISTNEDGTGGSFTEAKTTLTVYKGGVDDTANWTLSYTNGTGISGSLSGTTYSATGMTVDNGVVTLKATNKADSSLVLTKKFTLSKSRNGEPAVSYSLVVLSGKTIKKYKERLVTDSDGIPSINKGIEYDGNIHARILKYRSGTQTTVNGFFEIIEVGAETGSQTIKFFSSTASQEVRYNLSTADLSNVIIKVYADRDKTTLLDVASVDIISDGQPSITIVNTNPNISLPADYKGVITDYSASTGKILVYEGTTDVTSLSTFSVLEGNRNLYSLSGFTNFQTSPSISKVTKNVQTGDITVTVSGNDPYVGGAINTGSNWNATFGPKIPIKPGRDMFVTITNPIFTKNFISFLDSTGTATKGYASFLDTNKFKIPAISFSENDKFINLRFGIKDNVGEIGKSYTTKIKVEYSSHGTDWTPNPDDLGYQDSDYLDVAPDGSFSFYPISNTKDFVKANIKISYRDMDFTSAVNLTKTKAGKDGSDAKLLFLTSDKQIFTLDKDGTPKESSITVRALNQNVEGDATFTVKGIKENGTTELISVNPSNNTITLPSVLATKYSQIEVKATIADLHDTLTISVVRDGSPSVTTFLTNEAVTLAASNTGVVTANGYNGAKGYFKVYDGSTDVSNSVTYSVTPPTGVTVTISSGGAYIVNFVADNLDSTLVTFVATYKGQTYSKDFSISKSKMGAAGIDAKMLTLSSDRDYFAFDKEGQAKPSNQTINVSANLHNISGNPTFEVKGYNADGVATTISLTPSGTNLSIPVSEMGSYIYLTVRATLTVAGITYSDIKTFSRVTDGSQSLTGWLTNESITVPASNMGTVLSSDLAYLTGTFKVFYGSEDVTSSSSFSYTRNDNAYTFNINDSGVYSISTLSASLDTFSIPLTATYKGKTISKVLTISKSKMGSPGQDAKILNLTTTRNYFAFDKEGQAKPADQKVTITAHLKNIEGTASFEVKGYDSSNHATKISLAPTTANVLEIPVTQMASYVYLTVRAYVSVNNATYEDFTTIGRVTDGSQALVGLLTNESITVPATSNGIVSSTDLAYLTGSFKVFYGSEDVTDSSKFSYTRDDAAYTFTIDSSGVYTISALSTSVDTFSIPVKATYKDKEVSKVISISKSKTGAAGSNAKILTLTSDIQVFTLDKDGNPKGSNITVKALLQNLTGVVGFTVKGVKANGSETTISVSPTNNSFILDRNLAKTYDLVKITASLSGLTDTLTLPVVKDATLNITGVLTKETTVLAAANDGSVSTDAYNETKGYFKVYEGSTEVTGSTTFSVDRNLVIKHTATSGIRLGVDVQTNLLADTSHSTTAYFPVEPNTPYTLRTYETVSEANFYYSLSFYSNDNTDGGGWIERPSGAALANDLKNGRTFISPANARFARVSYPTSHPKVKLIKGKYTSDYTLAPEDSGVNAVINADGSYAVTSIPKNLDTVSVTLNGDYNGTRVTKVFTISKSKMGAAGLDARILNLSSTRDYFSYDRDNQPKPDGQTITFNANLNNLSGTSRFEVKGYNDANVATVINLTSTTPNVLTLPISAMGSYVYVTVRAYITSDNKIYEDTKTISRVMDGSQTLVGWLTNESITVPATNNGSVSSTDLAYITGTFKVFYGSEDVTEGSTFSYTRNDTAYTFSINNYGVYTVSALSTSLDSFSIPIKATYRGKEVSKVLSISKSRTGSNGTSSYMWIMYAKDKNGTDAVTIVTPDKEAEYTYIGFASTNTPERPTASSGKYTWTRYTGKDGIGINGRSVHIKYSNDGGKTFTGNNGEVAGKYIGIYVDDKLEDSNNPVDYTWNKAQGDDALPTYPNLISKGTLLATNSKLSYDAKSNTYTVTTNQTDDWWGSGITLPDTQVPYGESYRVSAYVYVDSSEESLFAVDFNNSVQGVTGTNDHDWRDDSVIDGHSGNDAITRVPGRTWHSVYWGTTNKVPELIDESKFTRGWLKGDGSGEIVAQDVNGERTTDFIRIYTDGSSSSSWFNSFPYVFKYNVSLSDGQASWASWQFYDSNKQPVGGLQGYGQVNDSSGNWSKTSEITVPTNVAYIRLSFRSYGNGHISFKHGLNPNEVPMYVHDTFGIRSSTAPKVFKIRDVKLELGKHVTPWVGSEEDLKGDPGFDAITPILTNDSITVPSDSDGNVSSSILSKVTTTVKIYKGIGELTDLNSWTFSASTLNGSGTYTMSGATLKLTGITSEILNIQITASHQTYGTYNRVFTVTKSKTGDNASVNITPALLPGYNLSYVPSWGYTANNPSVISPSGNGWAKFYLKNTTGTEQRVDFRLPKVDGLTEGVPYTFLMEVRNNKSTYVESCYVTACEEAAFYKLGTSGQLKISNNHDGGVKRVIDTVNCPVGLDNSKILAEFNINVPNGQTLDVEFRFSIYTGKYYGSYIPYQGSKNPYYYDLSLSSLVVTKNPTNTFSPASITAKVNKFSDGETVPANAVYKVIEFNSAGTQLKTITTESVESKTYTISNVNCSYLTIYAYNPNNTAEEWDHQTVYVVKDGTDSYSMDIVSDKGFIFSFDKDNNAVGITQITLTPRITGNFTPTSYSWTKNGTAAGTSGVLTINSSELKSTNNITVGLTVNGKSAGVAATLTNYVNVTKAKDGSDAYIVHLSREVTAFPTNESGALLGNLTNNTTTVTAYKGTGAITPTITNLTTSGCTASYSGTTVTITGISADSGYVDIAVSLEGHSVGTKRFSFVKVRQGQTMRMYNAWANSADGTVDFSTTESLGKKYIGVCTTTATTAPTTPSSYKWTETANNFIYGGRNWLMNSDFLENQDYWTVSFPTNGQTEVLTDGSDSVTFWHGLSASKHPLGVYDCKYRDHMFGNTFNVTSGKTYTVRLIAEKTKGSLPLQGGIWYTEQTSGNSWDGFWNSKFTQVGESSESGLAIWESKVTVPDGKTKGQVYVQLEQDFNANNNTTAYRVYDAQVFDENGNPLITDENIYGSITSPKAAPNGTYIWKRTILTYSDNTTDTIWENSGIGASGHSIKRYFRIKNTTSNGGYIGVSNSGVIPVIKGDKVTVSGYIRVSNSSKPASIFKLEEDNVSGNEVGTQIYNWNSAQVKWDRPFIQNDDWNRFQVTYTITNENTRLLRFFMQVDHGIVDYKQLKLEAGNVATQWSPSPDDYARRLAAVRTKADKANADIADMAADSKITPLEKIQVSREIETIKAEYPLLVDQAITFGATDERNTYTTRYNSLINFVNPLLANMSTTSDINTATFKATFKDYYTARTNLLNKIYKTLNDNTTNTASVIRKQISNVIQDITGWSVTTSDTYLTNATGSVQSTILNQLKSTIETTAKSIDLTVSSTTTGKKLNDNYYNKSQADSRYATVSVTDNRINLVVNGQTKTSFQINDGNIIFDLSGGGGSTTKIGTYTAYAWSPNGKDRFTKTKPQENMLVFSSDTANYAKSAPAPFVEHNDNDRGHNSYYQDMGWLSKDRTKSLKDLGFKVGDKLSILFKFTVTHGGGTFFQLKACDNYYSNHCFLTGTGVGDPGTYIHRDTVTLTEDTLKAKGFYYFNWSVYNYLENSKSFTGSNITGSATLDSSTYEGFPVRYYKGTYNFAELFQFTAFASLEPGQTYTVSFWAKGTGKFRVYLWGEGNYLQVKTAKTNQNVTATWVNAWGDGAIDFTLSSNWERYWVTYTMKDAFPTSDTSVKNHLLFRHLEEFGNTEQWFCGIQFEEGSKANTYTYLQSVQFEEMKIYREENPNEVFTLNPQDSYTESEPLYMGTSIVDSDNPADYKWELNPARKPITVYSNDDDFLLPSISEPRPNLIDNSDFRDLSQWQFLNQNDIHNDGSGENYVELSGSDYFYYGNANNRKFIKVSKTSALTLSFDYKENVRVNRAVAVIEIHSTEIGTSLLQRIVLPIGSFKGENINEMNKWKRIYYTFQNNFRQDVWITIVFYGPEGRNLLTKTNQGAANWDWTMSDGDKSIEEVNIDGVRAVKLTKGTTTPNTGWNLIQYLSLLRKLIKPSTQYVLSFDVKPSVDVIFNASLRRADFQAELTDFVSMNKALANQWTKVSCVLTTKETLPDDLIQVVYLAGMPTTNGNWLIIKNIKLEEVNVSTTPWCTAPEGRNLLINTDNDISITSHTTDPWPAWAHIDTGFHFEHGKTYTFSAEATNSTDKITEASIGVWEPSTNTELGIYTFPADGKRHSITFTIPNDSHDYHLLFYAGHAGIDPRVDLTTTYHHPKLEEGNVSTPWSPAPEDLSNVTGSTTNKRYFRKPKLEVSDVPTPWQEKDSDIPKYVGTGMKPSLSYKDFEWSLNPKWVEEFTKRGLDSTVNINDYVNKIGEINSSISNKADQTDLDNVKSTANSVNNSFNDFIAPNTGKHDKDIAATAAKAESNLNTFREEVVTFKFTNLISKIGDSGISISDSNQTMKMNLTNNRLEFTENGVLSAYISGKQFYITNGTITDIFQIGKHQFQKYNNEHTIVRWIN